MDSGSAKMKAWLLMATIAAAVGATIAITCSNVPCTEDTCRIVIGCDKCGKCLYQTNTPRLGWTCSAFSSTGQPVTGICKLKSNVPSPGPDICGAVPTAECVDLCATSNCYSDTVCESAYCDYKTGQCAYTLPTSNRTISCISDADTTGVCARYTDQQGKIRAKCSEWCVGVTCNLVDFCTRQSFCNANTGACVRVARNVGRACTTSGTRAVPCTGTCTTTCKDTGLCAA